MEIRQKVMVYYWKRNVYEKGKDEIVARSYKTSNGIIFETGTAFDSRNAVSNLRDFFTKTSSFCDDMRELQREVKRLEQKYSNTEIYTT